jgi:large subunit ribosomal protein L29
MKRREELDKYQDLSAEELRAETARLKESLFRLKFKLALGEVDAVKRIREEKTSLARLHTIARQRGLQASKAEAAG